MIFKLQRPITLTSEPMILVYDEYRKHMIEVPETQRLRGLFGLQYKIYVEGRINENQQIELERLLEPSEHPDW